MANKENFLIGWQDHKEILISALEKYFDTEYLVDCTLFCDGEFAYAHKWVLSACSPYFEILFKQHHDKHPIIVLKDLKFRQLQAILNFIYRGALNVKPDELIPLLTAAESLKIKGLGKQDGTIQRETCKMEQNRPPQSFQSIPHFPSRVQIEAEENSADLNCLYKPSELSVHTSEIRKDISLLTQSLPKCISVFPLPNKNECRDASSTRTIRFPRREEKTGRSLQVAQRNRHNASEYANNESAREVPRFSNGDANNKNHSKHELVVPLNDYKKSIMNQQKESMYNVSTTAVCRPYNLMSSFL